jgi:Uma2 family endonuclease
MVHDVARPLTLADVAQLAAVDDAQRYELVGGNLFIRPPDDVAHALLVTQIGVWLLGHGIPSDRVLVGVGLRLADNVSGRCPDLVLLARSIARGTVWVNPADAKLAVEVVSDESRALDRVIKPAEYARAGVANFWRIERDGGQATAHMYILGSDERGEPTYLGHRATLLDDLLASQPPHLA